MQSIGTTLKQQRLAKGLSLEQAAKGTKIRAERLEQMEADDFSFIPGLGYQKEFIRTYAKFLRVDANHLVREFEIHHGIYHEDVGYSDESPIQPTLPMVRARLTPIALVTLVMTILLLGVGIPFSVKLWRAGAFKDENQFVKAPVVAPKPVKPVVQEKKPANPWYAKSSTNDSPTVLTETNSLSSTNILEPSTNMVSTNVVSLQQVLSIQVKEDCWTRVIIDGREDDSFEDVLRAGEEKTFEGSSFRVKVSNPMSVSLTLNQKEVAGFSNSTAPKEITLP
ncbi:MAG: DUF4115 domain-containing protein [Verrucomicrobiota bacterium]|mgnify:CR=1 FL=1|nr:DUF4115 domain-containing protein [Verrucomicrobiota bacterium]